MLNEEIIEEYKRDNLSGLNNKEIIDEAISTLISSMYRKQDGFKRVEKVSLVAIYILQEYIEQLETAKGIKDALEFANMDLKTLMSLKYENDRLKTDKQKLIEKLEKDVINITETLQDGKHCDDYSRCRLKAYRTKTKEILKILKGEKE